MKRLWIKFRCSMGHKYVYIRTAFSHDVYKCERCGEITFKHSLYSVFGRTVDNREKENS